MPCSSFAIALAMSEDSLRGSCFGSIFSAISSSPLPSNTAGHKMPSSVPRRHRQARPPSPSWRTAPHISVRSFAGVLSLAAFFAILVAIGNGWNYRFLNPWFAHLPLRDNARLPQPKAALLPAGFAFAQSPASQPQPQDATSTIVDAFKTHDIVMFGEWHANKQEYDWLCNLVSAPEFDNRVDDIVVEFGNSLYQKSVDRYIAGENVPIEQVRKAWRNVIGAIGPPSPVYEQFYKAVRDANMKRRRKHQLRILLGDPYGDWEKIKDAEDLGRT